jgi:TonB family protein
MNAYLNYLIEANLVLLLFLICYKLLLKGETNFYLLRVFLLTGILASLLFPAFHVGNDQSTTTLSIGQVIPSYWLPEVVIGSEAITETHQASFNFWKYTTLAYSAGLLVFCLAVIFQLSQLFRIIRNSKTYRVENLRVAESAEDKPTFSFFRFVFIGNADQLSAGEKEQIIRHERVHAQQWHSFDILLINGLKIIFWFNPFIHTYKKIFIQLHEFEADARAVENSDVNKYCSLLAKVALASADFTLANHFNNSLTVKRIEMMRTLKTNIKRWKLAALAMMLPLVFFFVACQDQVGDDIMEITRNSSHALIVPDVVQSRFGEIKRQNPEKTYALLELNDAATEKLQDLQNKHGLPQSIEVLQTINGKLVDEPLRGESERVILERSKTQEPTAQPTDVNIKIRRNGPAVEGEQTFAILEFNDQASAIAEASQQDKVYTVVEKQPEFPGGYDAMMEFIKANMRYPAEARQKGIEGTVYISFIVGKDGAVSDVKPIRGIGVQADSEAVRVVESFPNWIPGKQSGEAVNVRFVLPLKFALNQSAVDKE